MSKSRDIADSAATINYIDGLTSDAQTQLDAKAVYPDQTGNSGKFLTTDGSVTSWDTVSAATPPGTLLRVTRYTTAGSGTWTRGAGTTSVHILTIAGGGGGNNGGPGQGGGGGGGAGGCAMLYVASAPASYSYTVGADGS